MFEKLEELPACEIVQNENIHCMAVAIGPDKMR